LNEIAAQLDERRPVAVSLYVRRLRVDRRDIAAGLTVTIAPLLAASLVLQLWRANLRIPLQYGGSSLYGSDSTFSLVVVKGILGHGWAFTNQSLGAPYGQELYDYPLTADNLNFAIVKALGLGTHDAALVLNLFYLLTFSLVSLFAYLVLRQFGISRCAASFAAVLYSLLPYHFWRNETHVWLSAYWGVPLALYLVLALLDDRPLFRRHASSGRPRSYLTRTTLATLACCVVAASTGLYYAYFAIVLLLTATAVSSAVRRSRRLLLNGVAVSVIIGAVLAFNLAPSAIYELRHGSDASAVQRQPSTSETDGLKLTELLLPVDGYRWTRLARLQSHYAATTPLDANRVEDGSQTLGTLGDIGFLTLLAILLASCVGSARWRPPALLQHASLTMIIAVLYGTVGGASTLVAYTLNSDVHAPGRICIFIAFLALLAVAVLIDGARARLGPSFGRARYLMPVLALLGVLAVLDQTSDVFIPAYAATAAQWRSDAVYGERVERALPHGAMVFELPYTSFPGTFPLGSSVPWDSYRLYLHTSALRFSYGAMVGRPQDWSSALESSSIPEAVTAAATAGFSAVSLDRLGYTDNGASADQTLRSILHERPIVSPDGRFELFNLRSFTARIRQTVGERAIKKVASLILRPSSVVLGQGFSEIGQSGYVYSTWTNAARSVVEIVNPSHSPRRVTFQAAIEGFTPNPIDVLVSYPGGTNVYLAHLTGETRIERTFTASPGVNPIVVRTDETPSEAGSTLGQRTYLLFLDSSVEADPLAQLTTDMFKPDQSG
jgi:hypothetical protein